MRRSGVIISAAVLAWAACIPGIASARDEAKADRSIENSVRTAQRYAECVVRKHRKRAAQMVLADAIPNELHEGGIMEPDCAYEAAGSGAQLSLPGVTALYLLANELVRKDLARLENDDFPGVPPLLHRQDYHDPSRTVRSQFGECIVRADPIGAKAALLTVPGSSDEETKLRAMAPALSGCMQAGQNVALSPHFLRGSIATNFFRLANAAREAAAARVVR